MYKNALATLWWSAIARAIRRGQIGHEFVDNPDYSWNDLGYSVFEICWGFIAIKTIYASINPRKQEGKCMGCFAVGMQWWHSLTEITKMPLQLRIICFLKKQILLRFLRFFVLMKNLRSQKDKARIH